MLIVVIVLFISWTVDRGTFDDTNFTSDSICAWSSRFTLNRDTLSLISCFGPQKGGLLGWPRGWPWMTSTLFYLRLGLIKYHVHSCLHWYDLIRVYHFGSLGHYYLLWWEMNHYPISGVIKSYTRWHPDLYTLFAYLIRATAIEWSNLKLLSFLKTRSATFDSQMSLLACWYPKVISTAF